MPYADVPFILVPNGLRGNTQRSLTQSITAIKLKRDS